MFVSLGCRPSSKPLVIHVPPLNPVRLTSAPEINSESQADLHDFVFYVEARKVPALGPYTRWLRATGLYHGKSVAFLFAWGADGKWKPFEGGVPTPMFRDMGMFVSLGDSSNALLAAIRETYGIKTPSPKMAKELVVGAISMTGDPRYPEQGRVDLKLFFGDESDVAGYGELYMDLDLPNARLLLREKNPVFEGPIVRSLATGTKS